MKAGKYSVRELFVNRYIQQIIIPEIQRDYVWKKEQVIGLLQSIKKDFENFNKTTIPKIETTDIDLKKDFEKFYKKRNNGSNIGFIYAYNDEQYSNKYFLIDGQQRITTIFLMLLVLASENVNNQSKFKKTYITDSGLKLDYKVRESAHHFLIHFAKQILDNNLDFINQNWYYNNKYDSDKTIINLLKNFQVIREFYKTELTNKLEDFYDYINNYVEFWYFDTNISEQGEELYIYMNARGEQMELNENIKADLLSKLNSTQLKNKYGKLWEDWQDYFWQNKRQNENADIGFNTFINWCYILNFIEKKHLVGTELLSSDIESLANVIRNERTSKLELKNLSIIDIELYFKTVSFFFNTYQPTTKSEPYFKEIVNENWLSGKLSQIDHFRLLPFLYFIKKHEIYNKSNFDFSELIKLNRFFYNLRQDETIGKTAATQTIYGIKFINELSENFIFDEIIKFKDEYKSLFNSEETTKLEILNNINNQTIKEKTRIAFYIAEDNVYLKGKIKHLITTTKDMNDFDFDYDIFIKIWNKYCDFLNNREAIISELITTYCFNHIDNRIKINNDWYKEGDGLEMLKKYYLYKFSLQEFIYNKQASFLENYNNYFELINEDNPKKQLYIYYLLSLNLGINWKWNHENNGGKNIGIIYNERKDLFSIFNKKMYFQHYNKQWHDKDSRIIEIQKNEISKEQIIELLKKYNHEKQN